MCGHNEAAQSDEYAAIELSITCPRCLRTSFNASDINEGYCGYCHAFTRGEDGAAMEARSGICRYCLCTDERACPDGCSWHDKAHTVCSSAPCVAAWEKYQETLKANVEAKKK